MVCACISNRKKKYREWRILLLFGHLDWLMKAIKSVDNGASSAYKGDAYAVCIEKRFWRILIRKWWGTEVSKQCPHPANYYTQQHKRWVKKGETYIAVERDRKSKHTFEHKERFLCQKDSRSSPVCCLSTRCSCRSSIVVSILSSAVALNMFLVSIDYKEYCI